MVHTITLPISGRTIQVRSQPLAVLQQIQQAAEAGAGELPKIPTVQVEVAPGVFRDVPNIDEEYRQEVAGRELVKGQILGTQMVKVARSVGVVTQPTDADLAELADLRASYAALDITMPEDDREAWLDYILLSASEDANTVLFEVFGRAMPQDAMVAFYRNLFCRDMEGPKGRAVASA